MNTDPLLGMNTGTAGYFKILNVPVGRHSVKVSFMGIKTVVIPELLVSSGKETVITVELEEAVVNQKEIEVKASVDKDKPIDRMALVGARSFNTDEIRRYAGGVDDPMRAVSNLAGVVSNAGDNSTRSPSGVIRRKDCSGLWKGLIYRTRIISHTWAHQVEGLQSLAARCFPIPIFILQPSLHNIVMPFQAFSICISGMGIMKNTKMLFNSAYRVLTCHRKVH